FAPLSIHLYYLDTFFFLTLPPPPPSTLFPYTTLFRSLLDEDKLQDRVTEPDLQDDDMPDQPATPADPRRRRRRRGSSRPGPSERSEERRVGKECRCRSAAWYNKKQDYKIHDRLSTTIV